MGGSPLSRMLYCFFKSIYRLSPYKWVGCIVFRGRPAKPWWAEVYSPSWLVAVALAFFFAVPGSLWTLVLFGFRLLDIMLWVADSLFVSPQENSDAEGPFIAVRDGSRWVFLAGGNVLEIILCFAGFRWVLLQPSGGHWASVYESLTVLFFNLPELQSLSSTEMALATVQSMYCLIFLLLAFPVVLTAIRVKIVR